jgi:hypothetical protein
MMSRFRFSEPHRQVLEAIRRWQPVARAELGRRLGIASGPMSQLTRDLLKAGVIIEGDPLRGGRGQPSRPLSVNPAGGLSFGASLSPGMMRTVALDFAGTVIQERAQSIEDGAPERVAGLLSEHIAAITQTVRLDEPSRIVGVGLAVPGFFFQDSSKMRTVSEHAAWRQHDLKVWFQARLGLPVRIENDATAAAMAEAFSSEGRTARSLVLLLINYGIGAGVVIDGRPLRGAHGNVGEIGAYYPLGRPRPSGSDLLAYLAEKGMGEKSLERADFQTAGMDAVLRQWVDRAAPQLETVLESAWAWLDPDRLVIGGALPARLLQALADALPTRLFALHPERPRPVIAASTLGPAVAAIGAACLPLHAVTHPEPTTISRPQLNSSY